MANIGDTIQDGTVVWKVNKALGLIGGGALTGDALTWNGNDLGAGAIVSKSIGNSGYIKYVNGLIIQWLSGGPYADSDGLLPLNLPISFSNMNYRVVCTNRDSLSGANNHPKIVNTMISDKSTVNKVAIKKYDIATSSNTIVGEVTLIAIGY